MKRGLIFCAALAATVAVSGCASNLGTQTVNDFGRYMQLEAGETTAPEVYETFGQPHQVAYIDETGERIWSYYSSRVRTNASTYVPFLGLVTGGNDVDTTIAVFYFDDQDTLLRTEREERSQYRNMWLGLGDAFTPSGQVEAVRVEMERLGLPFDERAARENAAAADMFVE